MSVFGNTELQNTEFKPTLAHQTDGFIALCAMVNAESAHGTVIFGAANDGTIVGLDPQTNFDTAQRTLAQHGRQKIDPLMPIDLQLRREEGKPVLFMSARRSQSVAFHEYDGRAYIREGSSSRMLSVAEKQRLLGEREVQRALGLATASLARLDRELIKPWESEHVARGNASQSTLELLEAKVTELEAAFRGAAGRDKPAYAAALREAYGLLLRRARGHYGSSSRYQTIRQRVVAGLLEIENIAVLGP